MAKNKYKSGSPARSIFWLTVLIFFVPFPWCDGQNLIDAISFAASGYMHDANFGAIPVLIILPIVLIAFAPKYPRGVVITANALMMVFISLYMSRLSYDASYLIGQGLIDPEQIEDVDVINGLFALIWFFASFRILGSIKKELDYVEPESRTDAIVIWTLILVIYIIGIYLAVTALFSQPPEFTGASGYAAMIGMVYYIFPLVYAFKLGVGAYRSLKDFRRPSGKSWGLKEAILLIIFIFSWFPIIGPLIDHGENNRDLSVYNTSWSGASEFKKLVENMGYETYSIQSSLSTLSRFTETGRSVCLVILAPMQLYNPISEIPLFIKLFKDPNFSMLIADDHGSTMSLMIDLFLAGSGGGEGVPLAIFPSGVLWDNQSYDRHPTFAVIKDIEGSDFADGITRGVIMSRGTAIFSIGGWNTVGRSSKYSWVDVDGDGKFTMNDKLTVPGNIESLVPGLSALLALNGPLTTFAFTQLGAGNRIFLSGDASIFNNELILNGNYDNARFASNIIRWLTRGNKSIAVVFDESHNIKRGTREFSSTAMFGLFQGYINWMSTNPFLAWIYPLWAFRTLRKWIPKEEEKKKKKKKAEKESEEKRIELKFRTSSFFARKINWYRLEKKYNQAILLLYRRIERRLARIMGGIPQTPKNVTARLKEILGRYITKDELTRIEKFLQKIEDIKNNKIEITTDEEFNNIFFEMEWFASLKF